MHDDMYDYMIDTAARQFALERVLKRGRRGTVELLRHLATGKRYVFRHYIGSADVYRKLLDITCPHLPRIEEVAEKDGAAFCPYCTATQVEIAVMPKGCRLEPNGCEFRGNGENVVNPFGYRVEMVDCTVS